jgi:predicted phosphodiesterase
MKIRVLSDLHLEFRDWNPPAAAADVVVLAGDIHVGVDGLLWGREHFPDAQILYVPGNHEFYGLEMESTLGEFRRVAKTADIHLLDADEVIIDGVRFLGATLWTDFALYGRAPAVVARAKEISARAMVDYRLIRMRASGLLTPDNTLTIHQRQVAWLANKLAQPFAGKTVVVTHHLPHPQSVHPRYAGDSLNPSFASDLSTLVCEPASLWIHGHTHESMDYLVNGTRVICNPRGYLPQEPNRKFKPRLVVDLGGPS